jgi:hypothetical protein
MITLFDAEKVMERLPGLKGSFSTILADPPWQFQNRTGKVAPEHKRLKLFACGRIMTHAL